METSTNLNRISKYFNLPALNLTTTANALAIEDTKYINTLPIEQENYIFGVEVEVENVPNPKINCYHTPYWTMTTDGSLRNHGVEFVSLPLRMAQLEKAFIQLFGRSLPADADFSERTSIHVHMNARDLYVQQIHSLILLYIAVEDLLFKWVGHDRDESIFCIKLTETDYVRYLHLLMSDPRYAVEEWNKYTALNLAPLASKGTVEFRHLAGTSDWEMIHKWTNLLACLKTAAKRYTPGDIFKQIVELNSTSLYEEFVRNIFKEYTNELLTGVNLTTIMEDAVSYVKLLVYHQPAKQTEKAPPMWNALELEMPTQAATRRTIQMEMPEGIPNVTVNINTAAQQNAPELPQPNVTGRIGRARTLEELRADQERYQQQYQDLAAFWNTPRQTTGNQ